MPWYECDTEIVSRETVWVLARDEDDAKVSIEAYTEEELNANVLEGNKKNVSRIEVVGSTRLQRTG